MNHTEHAVAHEDEGIRLDRWFKRHYPGISHAFLEKHLRKGLIRVDGKKAKSSDRVVAGQQIRVPELQAAPVRKKKKVIEVSAEEAKDLQQLVLHKDMHVLAINKPAGLAVQGGTGQHKNLDAMMDALRFDATDRPRLVHRLDRDTSGVLLLARSAKSAGVLAQKFADKSTRKLYWALVVGVPKPIEGTINLPILKKAKGADSRMELPDFEAMEVDEEEGKHAVTHFRVVERLADHFAWVELLPVTGRTHQLRVHMAAIGNPIVGDGKYGGAEAFVKGMNINNKLHLHARRIVVPQCFGKTLDIKAPLPPHMKESWKSFDFSERDPKPSLLDVAPS